MSSERIRDAALKLLLVFLCRLFFKCNPFQEGRFMNQKGCAEGLGRSCLPYL